MNVGRRQPHPGVVASLAAAILLGLSTPLAEVHLGGLSPWILAGLLYLGSGVVFAAWRLARGQRSGQLARSEVLPLVGAIGGLGSLSYGLSLVLFIMGLRSVGTARSGAYFSMAPFFGGLLAVAMGEQVTPLLVAAAVLMAGGVWLHISEHHAHQHTHARLVHDHSHVHDAHHHHAHDTPVAPGVRHRHLHEPITHEHAHFPDIHHGIATDRL